MHRKLIAAACIAGGLACCTCVAGAADARKLSAVGAASPAQPAKGKPVDINGAPSAALQQIPGIGEDEAAKIIAGRPYNSKADLVSRKIVSDATYAAIKDRILVKPRVPETKGAK